MDEATYTMIESLIPGDLVEAVMAAARKRGDLQGTAKVVAEHYALQPKAVIEWYEERLRRRAAELLDTAAALRKESIDVT